MKGCVVLDEEKELAATLELRFNVDSPEGSGLVVLLTKDVEEPEDLTLLSVVLAENATVVAANLVATLVVKLPEWSGVTVVETYRADVIGVELVEGVVRVVLLFAVVVCTLVEILDSVMRKLHP